MGACEPSDLPTTGGTGFRCGVRLALTRGVPAVLALAKGGIRPRQLHGRGVRRRAARLASVLALGPLVATRTEPLDLMGCLSQIWISSACRSRSRRRRAR